LCLRYAFAGIWADLMLLVRRLVRRGTSTRVGGSEREPAIANLPSA
jgi:hypothetical protein